jgi:enoyl-CoA hydratase/carnithine racemase
VTDTTPTSTDAAAENEGHGPEVLYEVADHIATITLNRPHRRNAISVRMLQLLSELFAKADDDSDVRVVLLTGAGKGFCSGYGLDLALGCDMRLMASSAALLPGFAKRGVVPESGGTWYLPRLLGWAKAAEISYLGRDLDAAEAERIGLVNRAVPDAELMPLAHEWAGEIAANAPLAIRAMKRLFRHGQTQDFESHSHHVLLQTMQLFGTKDFQEGLLSFMEKRPPTFRGR